MGYVMQEGSVPGLALYSSCEDALWAQAELVLLTAQARKIRPGAKIVGYYDVLPDLSIAEFKRSYKGKDLQRLVAARAHIIAHGWQYPWEDGPETSPDEQKETPHG